MPTASLQQTLDFLGSNSNEVAIRLRQCNIRGQWMSRNTCPVAQYLMLSGFSGVKIGYGYIQTHQGAIPTPSGIRAFIRRFDRYDYPELTSL
jgi:hypothetical protein